MASSTRTCYNRDGSPITDIAYQPCASDIERDSFCCGTNHQGAGHTNVADDVCESNGLCQNYEAFDGTNEGVKLWWRQGCTDPTWQSAECLGNICNESQWQDDNAPVRKCGENSWCCGDASCCSDTASLFALAAVAGEPMSSTSSSLLQSTSAVKSSIPASSSTNSATPSTPTDTVSSTLNPRTSPGASTTSPTADPPSSISNTSNSSQELSIGVRAGIGIGAAMIVILLVLVALLAWSLKKKRKQERRVTVELPHNPLYEKYQEMSCYPPTPAAELYAGNAAAEMGCRDPAELGIGRNMLAQEERPYGLDDPKVVLQP